MSESPVEDAFAYLTATRELELRKQLCQLALEYRKRAKPIIDELVKIEAAKPPRPFAIDLMRLHPASQSMQEAVTAALRRYVDLPDLAGAKPENEVGTAEGER